MQLRHCYSSNLFILCLCVSLYLVTLIEITGATESHSSFTDEKANITYLNQGDDLSDSTSGDLQKTNATTLFSNNYSCPSHCDCIYRSIKKLLEINCHLKEKDANRNQKDELAAVNVSHGVKHLIIRNASIDSKIILSLFPVVAENFMVHLELHRVTLSPLAFFNSHLFRFSHDSLQRLEITSASVFPSDTPDSTEKTVLRHFGRLKALSSLTVSDSSSELSNLIIQSLPVVKSISITNSSIKELYPENFAHLIWLKSLNLSHNRITTIPARLTQNLRNLVSLDVSSNFIEHLQENVFVGLVLLRNLNASHNKIRYVDTEVFNPLADVQVIDLSHNNVIQIFEPYFTNNRKLKTLQMKNTWTANTFIDSETSARSQMEMERLINTLQSVQKLDLSDNQMKIIPETLTHAPKLSRVYLHGNQWSCRCQDRWFLYWIETTSISIEHFNNTNLWCHTGSAQYPVKDFFNKLDCTDQNIYNKNPNKYYTHLGQTARLQCHTQGPKWPVITWITPKKQHISYKHESFQTESNNTNSISTNLHVYPDGNLRVSGVTNNDFGLYICIAQYKGVAQYKDLNITHYVHVGVDTTIFNQVRIRSFVIGWMTSFAFLLVVVIAHVIRMLLRRCGLECVSVSKTYQTRRVRAFFESIEQHKSTQLDWLRDNYNMQACKIKDNCFSQLERIRDSYTIQSKNLTDIRDYGTSQIHQLRDQYHDQIRRVSGYSAHQLCKVRENYLFQRNRVCKFSSHQLLKLRETYKWQAQTLNKILENLPRTLTLDTCRGIGTCGRTDSIYLEDISEFQSIDNPYPHHMPATSGYLEELEHKSLLIPPEFVDSEDPRLSSNIVVPDIQSCNNLLTIETESAQSPKGSHDNCKAGNLKI